MIIVDKQFSDNLFSSVRKVETKVEVYNGSTLAETFRNTDKLKSFTVERVGEDSKFFGFGICQKINIKLIDIERKINISTANNLKIYIGFNNTYSEPFPVFYVSQVHRDENTNELSITAYDKIYAAASISVAELALPTPYTIKSFTEKCAQALGLVCAPVSEDSFNLNYTDGANFSGSERLREALDDIAEATQTIYFINGKNQLSFKRLDKAGEVVEIITKDKYFTLSNSDNKRLSEICHATELGDNVSAALDISGSTQYVRDNCFWELREDIGTLVDNALGAVGGMTICQFTCSWRGNFLVELGDKIGLTTKDNKIIYSYLLNDTVSYDGTYSQQTQWKYDTDNAESASNPTTIGEALNQTFAKVDKINKEIDLVASEVNTNKETLSQLQITTDKISGSVSSLQSNLNNSINGVNEDIAAIKREVEATMTSEEVNIAIKKELENGTNRVQTITGFTFDETGLKVSKPDSEIDTQISEDGMKVNKNGSTVLSVNNEGVKAEDLHATTYLIMGKNSRFEDYGSNRTGCFWIGD